MTKRLFQRAPRHGFHQLLGHPERENLDPDTVAEWIRGQHAPQAAGSSAAANGQDWVLLLEVRSDDDGLGVTWGQGGRLLFAMREQDLRRRVFHTVELLTTYA